MIQVVGYEMRYKYPKKCVFLGVITAYFNVRRCFFLNIQHWHLDEVVLGVTICIINSFNQDLYTFIYLPKEDIAGSIDRLMT